MHPARPLPTCAPGGWLGIVSAPVLLLTVLIALAGCSPTSSTRQPAQTTQTARATPQPQQVRMGEPADDGQRTFVVQRVTLLKTRIVRSRLGDYKAQGRLWQVAFTVKNNVTDIRKGFHALPPEHQYLYDRHGHRAIPVTHLYVMLAAPYTHLIPGIQPGKQQSIVALFDVPEDFMPDRVQLHDSPESPGITIKL